MTEPVAVLHVDVFNVQVGVFRTFADCGAYLVSKGVSARVGIRPSFGEARMDVADDGLAWFSLVITDEATVATRVHECVHMADWIMDHLGIPTDISNSEVRGYLTGHLYAELAEALP